MVCPGWYGRSGICLVYERLTKRERTLLMNFSFDIFGARLIKYSDRIKDIAESVSQFTSGFMFELTAQSRKYSGTVKSAAKPVSLLALAFIFGVGLAWAEDVKKIRLIKLEKSPPYGTYTPQPGRWYGRKRQKMNGGEARQILVRYYNPRGLKVGRLSDRNEFFQTDIYRGDVFVDRIIIHKATGRIRSVY